MLQATDGLEEDSLLKDHFDLHKRATSEQWWGSKQGSTELYTRTEVKDPSTHLHTTTRGAISMSGIALICSEKAPFRFLDTQSTLAHSLEQPSICETLFH
jgi:hypothetical protein